MHLQNLQNDVFRTGSSKKTTQRYSSLYEVCALLRLFICIITVQYRSYTINSYTNPHNLASRRLWWVAEGSLWWHLLQFVYLASKQSSKERKKNKQKHCTRQGKMTEKSKTCCSNSTQACYKSHKSPSPRSGLSHASGSRDLAWLRPERLWRRLIDHRSLA